MRDELDIPMPRMAPAEGPSYRVSRAAGQTDIATKRLAIIAAGIGGALLVLVGVWSVEDSHRGGVPVVEADSRPWRTKPDNPGGMQVAGENETILSGVTGGKDAMAPPPEVPAPQALKAEAGQQVAAKAATAIEPNAAALTPPATLPDPGTKQAAAEPAAPMVSEPAPEQPVAPPVVAKAALVAAPAASGSATVQLAAVGSEHAAMSEWQRLAHKMPALLGDRHPAVLRADHDGKTFYRLRTGGFADIARATAFCEQVRAKGAGCALARF